MRIWLHIGPEPAAAARLQQVLDDKRANLLAKGILFPRSAGARNDTRLFMAVTDPAHVDPLRHARGLADPDRQTDLRARLAADLAAEIAQHQPHTLILSAAQLGSSLHRASELDRLHALLAPLSEDIRILAHVDNPARALARHYAAQIFEGRAAPLDRDLALASAPDWWQACLATMPAIAPDLGQFEETQGAPFWLDHAALTAFWEGRFGTGNVTLRPYDPALFASDTVTKELRAAFEIAPSIGKAKPAALPEQPSAAWVARARQLNLLLLRLLEQGRHIPRALWRSLLAELAVPGPPIDPATLDLSAPTWAEADPLNGYRASQYLLAFLHRIDRATKEATRTPAPENPALPPQAARQLAALRRSPYAPHNRLGTLTEDTPAAPYTPAPPRDLPQGSSGRVIVGCMKNEAPYILEWIAYHRAIGFDDFLIYSNGCEDGTSEILDRLQQLGLLQHRNNDSWKGKSPQQHALNKALKEPVVRNAEWIAHIDVDEFINVRCGNGTLDDFFARVPEATNVAMTWRLFGHNGVRGLADAFVIDQFDTCAPRYCPKPHTVWGFKTLFRNIGAYSKLSCHRPNKLAKDQRDRVRWVNGSGQDITAETAERGWRSSTKSIGYDLLQLNHYAVRSADSFLIKRQRGRALHVDRAVGLNYWIRMDWSGVRDLTIKRNLPRLRAEYDRLLADAPLRALHEQGLAWHRARARDLHQTPEFRALYDQALRITLTETERVAYALALDMES
ncbi:glycosyltransferase family 2 protein [Seohaeicola nanhaiensis]|uniref:Glycosyltransferase family 2 protein n=1 Tax=Seohaeicola nanhaiensis TaxID=1387282 RepID=A0ABV9KF78_9RHOB